MRVVFADGTSAGFDVVAEDRQIDVALLRLHSTAPAGAIPLRLDSDPARRGEAVVAIRPKSRASDRWEVSRGAVTYVGSTQVVADTPLRPGNSGGPLLRCNGEVLGVATSEQHGRGFYAPAPLLATLFDTATDTPSFRFRMRLTPSVGAAGVLGVGDGRVRLGMAAGIGLNARRLGFRFEPGLAWVVADAQDTALVNGSQVAVTGYFAYRFPLPALRTSMRIGAGASYLYEHLEEIEVRSGVAELAVRRTHEVEPLGVVRFQVHTTSLGWQLLVDTDSPSESELWFSVGVPWQGATR